MTSDTSKRPVRVWFVVTAALIVGCSWSLEPTAEGNDPRLLDRACENELCTLTGSAQLTDGITADSIGIRLGPGAGKASIERVFEPSSTRGPVLAILAAGTGISHGGGQPITPSSEYRWIDVSGTPSSDGVVLELEVDGGATLEIVDIRSATYDWSDHSCSVASRGVGLR